MRLTGLSKHNERCDCKHCQRKRKFAGVDAVERANKRREESDKTRFQSGSVRQIGNSSRSAPRAKPPRTGPTPEELHWRLAVLVRDGYCCVFCGSKEDLEADHIKPKFLYPDLKYEVSNGRTLCNPCHKNTPTYGGKVRKLAGVDVEENGNYLLKEKD